MCLRAANIRKAFALHKGVHADHEIEADVHIAQHVERQIGSSRLDGY
jgi:hypothetical protein